MRLRLVLVEQLLERVIKKDIVIAILVQVGIVHLAQMVTREQHLRNAVAEQLQALAMRVVRRLINTVVAARVTHPEAVRHVVESIRVVIVAHSINGAVVHAVIVGIVTNMRVV